MTFEAPGYSDPDLQASVADGCVWLVVAAPPGGKVCYSDDRGKTEDWYTLRQYTFPVANSNWQQKYADGFEVKRVNSIAMNPSMWYSAPPNAVFGGDDKHKPPLYTSGSFVTGGGWSYPCFHEWSDGDWSHFVTLGLTPSASPAAPYVSGGYVDTLGKQR